MDGTTTIWFLAATLVPAAVVSWSAGFAVRRLAPRWGWVDRPGHRKVHSAPIPLGGGLAIWLAVVTPFLLGTILVIFIPTDAIPASASGEGAVWGFVVKHAPGVRHRLPDLWILLSAATLLMGLGLADDRRGLDWRIRLAVQLGVAAVVVGWRGWQATVFLQLPVVTAALSVLWIVALVNSFNMLDNMDGLSAGVAGIVGAMLATHVLWTPDLEPTGPQLFVGGFLLVLLGALIGFLWHNRPPARMFMGDAGSYFVGFSLGVATLLATFANYGNSARHALLAPFCILAVPLYDLVTVLAIRLREGRRPFEGDTSHFSHRLVDLGFTKGQAVLTIYLMTAACGLAGLMLPRLDAVGAVMDLLLVGCVLALIAVIEFTARHRIRRDAHDDGRPFGRGPVDASHRPHGRESEMIDP